MKLASLRNKCVFLQTYKVPISLVSHFFGIPLLRYPTYLGSNISGVHSMYFLCSTYRKQQWRTCSCLVCTVLFSPRLWLALSCWNYNARRCSRWLKPFIDTPNGWYVAQCPASRHAWGHVWVFRLHHFGTFQLGLTMHVCICFKTRFPKIVCSG